jgi:hypothetical protein
MSGDMCTSLGNGFTNLMLYKYLLHTKGGHGKALVEGDDGLFACDVPLTAEDYKNIGWTVEIKELTDPCRGHFCGMTFGEDGEIVKDPRRVLQTFCWTTSFIHAGNRVMDSLLKSKAQSLCYELPQCPIIGALARESMRLTEGVDVTHRELSWGRDWTAITANPIAPFAPKQATRDLVAELFGISVELQLAVEAAIWIDDFETVSRLLPPTNDVLHYTQRYLELT